MQQFMNGNYVNPYLQRLQNMEQQYPQQQQFQQPQVQANFFRTLLVSNVEEANATQVAFDGTPTFFYNASKGEVYLKKISTQTGLVEFQKFGLIQAQSNDKKPCSCSAGNYDKRFESIESKLDGIYSILGQKDDVQPVKKEVKNAKQ